MDIPIDFVIHSASVAEPDSLRAYAERRLAFALDRFEDRARRVIIRIRDINGPRRGVDSLCSITLTLRDGRRIEAESVTAFPFASITLAAKRLASTLRRDIEKTRVSFRRRRASRYDAGA